MPHIHTSIFVDLYSVDVLVNIPQVRAYTSVSEVSVVYRLHEFSIELFVRLPANYPLQPPSIREGKRVKVEVSQWRKWMLQLNVFIANQVSWLPHRGFVLQ